MELCAHADHGKLTPFATQLLDTWNSTASNSLSILAAGAKIEELLLDVDAILATNDNYLLSKWIGEAKSWSTSPSEVAFLEYQARNQISEYHLLLAATHSLTNFLNLQLSGEPRRQLPGPSIATRGPSVL